MPFDTYSPLIASFQLSNKMSHSFVNRVPSVISLPKTLKRRGMEFNQEHLRDCYKSESDFMITLSDAAWQFQKQDFHGVDIWAGV